MTFFVFWVTALLITLFFFYKKLFRPYLDERETRVTSRDALREIVEKLAKSLDGRRVGLYSYTGEADVRFHGRFAETIRQELASGRVSEVRIMFGPEISTWQENKRQLVMMNGMDDKWFPGDGLSEGDLRQLHPYLSLIGKPGFSLYLNTHEQTNHFPNHMAMLGDRTLFIEDRHDPLQGASGVLVENPNPLRRRHYRKLMEKLVEGATRIDSVDDMRKIPYAWFAEHSSSGSDA